MGFFCNLKDNYTEEFGVMISGGSLYRYKLGVLLIILGSLIVMGCRTSGDVSAYSDIELREIVNQRNFSIKFQWAQPQRGGMIDLTTNPNELTMKDDMVDIFLPYFGVRHRGGAYNQNKGGIHYKGKISDLQINEASSGKEILMKFNVKEDPEFLEFILTMYNNGKTHLSVSSSERENIVYQGSVIQTNKE